MPSVGPTLPPHLSKRSRDDDDNRASSPDSSDKRRRVAGPAPPPTATAPPRNNIGPSLPPASRSRSSSTDSDTGPAPPPPAKSARVVGPAPPPAPLDQRPPNPPEQDSDSSDDDFGPAPPPAGAQSHSHDDDEPAARSAFDTDPQFEEAPKKAQRDDWMTMPPTQDDLAARMDPTKMRARKFNTGKSAGAGGGGMSSAWTETPEQKLKRLQDEAMGITSASASAAPAEDARRSKEEERRARKMREKIDAARGKSLVEQHQEKGTGKEKEDDPSKRVFNYEKDMAVAGTVNHKQRREMLNKSKGFGDRFSSGNFL